MQGERGSALVIAVLVMAVLTLLGMSYLLMADTENKIAENERLSAQALYFAEGVTREIKRWFDRPPYTDRGASNLVRPTTAILDRTKRLIDEDGPGPSKPKVANTFYKGGVDLDHDTNDDIFDKPYRPGPADMFLGTAEWPDISIDRVRSPAVAAFLDTLAEKVMPGFPAASAGVLARIKKIDFYEPPYLDAGGGTWVRYGVVTVSVQVQILRNPDATDELVMADRTVTAVFNETPFAGAYGPFHSCDEIGWDNAFKVHWGPATAATTANLPTVAGNGLSLSIPRDLPPTPKVDTFYGHLSPAGDTTWGDLVLGLNTKTIQDPWFRFFAGLNVQNWSGLNSPQLYPSSATTDQDRSNRFQDYPNVPCPEFDYETWKTIARAGGSDVHYFAWDPLSSKFKENGVGLAKDLPTLTNGKTGLFFFDTKDGLAPHDFNASNVAANLTPAITIHDSSYGTRGFLYVNAEMWRVTGSPGRTAEFTFPGEPFRDENENGVKDGDSEEWINLNYSALTAIDDPIKVDSLDTYDPSVPPPATPAPIWNALGPTFEHPAIVWGILYLTGQFDASGTPYYDGSVITFAGTETGEKTAGTANLYWDPKLKNNWPPPDWDLPRVIITGWQTDH